MKYSLLICILLCCASGSLRAQTGLSQLAGQVKDSRPGDTIIVKNGEYRDVELILTAKGDSIRPIVVKAETPGGVIVSGSSVLRIAGTGLELNGFHFTNGFAPKGAAWEFRAGNEVANYCRITQCAIDSYEPPSRETEYSWILLYGRHNRFDHNTVSGKLNNGVTLAVILDEERNIKNGHVIEYNHFRDRPNLGSNGGETIRVGTSQSSLLSSNTVIQNNWFEHCDGEVEIISIKSCDNIIRQNTFFESAGVLALRHGHRNKVDGNIFIGNNKPNTGGIRVINEGHLITNNIFYQLAGDRFFAALAIMNAVPNSLPNRYHQVKDVVIANNSWIDCQNILFCVGKDNERTLPPANVTLKNNNFFNKNSNTVFKTFDRLDGFDFIDNKVKTRSGAFAKPGFAETRSYITSAPEPTIPRSNVGAGWFVPKKGAARVLSGRVIKAEPGQNSLNTAVASAAHGDIIELANDGVYLIDQPIPIKKYIRIVAAAKNASSPVIRYNGTKGKAILLTIEDGGQLEISGIAFNNEAMEGKASATAAIGPAAIMKGHYSAFIDRCEFFNYTEASMSPFRAQKTTYADSLVFTSCLFRDMSGDAIYLSAEKDDAGKYSAENVIVQNCAFYKVLGYALDLYRGGSDESTTGPTLLFDHCVLEDVNNKERGAGLRLFGVQNVTVRNTLFSNTGRGGAAIRFDENSWDKIDVNNCSFFNSGKVNSFFGKVVTGPVYNLRPEYRNAARFDFRNKPGSALSGKATDRGDIGLTNTFIP